MLIKDEIAKIVLGIQNLEAKLTIEKAVLARLRAIEGTRPRKVKSGRPPKEHSLAAHIREVLIVSNGPMDVYQLVLALEKRGVTTDGKSALSVLVPSAISRRPDIFEIVRRGVYGLVPNGKTDI